MLRFLSAKQLSVDEYYDVVIFGYLRGVMRYLSDKSLQRYRFSTIAFTCMNTDLGAHRRKEARKKRQAEIISIHSSTLATCAATGFGSVQHMDFRLLMQDLERQLSPLQREILWLRLQGDSIQKIARKKKIPKKNVHQLLDGVGTILKQLLQK